MARTTTEPEILLVTTRGTSMTTPRTTLVYDLPTRLFHILFGGMFVTAFTIANVADESLAFPYHMLAGALLAALVILRLIWGIAGTRYARFSSFELAPGSLIDYFKAMFRGGTRTWTGHNPASSWAALIMIGCAAGLAITGVLMVNGHEQYEDVHELLANAFLATALLHVAGVLVHQLRHRDGFAFSMVDGRKQAAETDGIARARPVAGLVMLALVAALGVYLLRGFDPATGTLRAFGTTLQLHEAEAGGSDAEEEDDDD
jgi:cytochrome b